MIGKEVLNYRIVKTLGEGGMGSVYHAVHKHIPTLYSAIKVLHPSYTNNPNIVTKFQREAVVLSQLNHPNIVRLLDFTQKGRQFYLIMEYVEGQSLAAIIKETAPMPEERVIYLFNKILDAFQYAHDQAPPIIHRDIKPSNIIIGNNDEPKVIDFGIVKILESEYQPGATVTGTLIGTAPYMSPEQIRGKDVDHRADIYALGITLFYMVTGRLPFPPGLSEYDLLHHIVSNQVCQAKQVYPQVSTRLNAAIAQATANDKNARFSTCAAFKAALNKKTAVQNKKTAAPAKRATAQSVRTVVQDIKADVETKGNEVIHFFYANKPAVKRGDEVILTWNTAADKKVLLEPMRVEGKPIGTYSHRPDRTTTYRLSVGGDFKEVTVAVKTGPSKIAEKIGSLAGAAVAIILLVFVLPQRKCSSTSGPQDSVTETTNSQTPLTAPVTISALQETLIVNRLERFFKAENNNDINSVLSFYAFPVEQFGQFNSVDQETLQREYEKWFNDSPHRFRTIDWSTTQLSVTNTNRYKVEVRSSLVTYRENVPGQQQNSIITFLLNPAYEIVSYVDVTINPIQ